MNYRLTKKDVFQYLLHKQDHESIGICADAMNCLLTQVFQAKYPETITIAIGPDDICAVMTDGVSDQQIILPMTQELDEIQVVFDSWTEARHYTPVPKYDFMLAWKRYEDGKYE